MVQFPQTLRRHWLLITIAIVVIVPVFVFTVWAGATLNYSYSSGQRAGFLQKVSKTGWLCKSWEGELQLNAIPGSPPEKFLFTTRSDSIAELLNKYSGQRVVVDYQQHKGVPTTCFGNSEYFVVAVRPVAP
jgi:hypothetical protein